MCEPFVELCVCVFDENFSQVSSKFQVFVQEYMYLFALLIDLYEYFYFLIVDHQFILTNHNTTSIAFQVFTHRHHLLLIRLNCVTQRHSTLLHLTSLVIFHQTIIIHSNKTHSNTVQ